MVAVKPLDQIADKFVARASAAATDYDAGVRAPKEDWQKNTAAAEPNYAAGVQQAIAQKRFGKGVARAGTAKWQRKAIDVGVGRYPAGVAAAKEDYQTGFAPYHGVLSRIVLPKKGPRGSAQNYNRVKAIGDALFAQRTGGAAPTAST